MSRMTGARHIAETFKGYGVTHAFYMEIILPRALAEMERLGIRRIVTHSEKKQESLADASHCISVHFYRCGRYSLKNYPH